MSTPLVQSCQAYKTSDNQTHPSRLVALTKEREIKVKGLLQSSYTNKYGKPPQGPITMHELVPLLIGNGSELANVIRKFDKAIKAEQAKGAAGS